MVDGCYVYAIQARDTPLPDELVGIGDARLALVPYGALSAVTSGLNRADLLPSAAQLIRHEVVVEAVCRSGPALPVRFGTLLPDTHSVSRLLAERYDTLIADLERLGTRVELGLAILWNVDQTAASPLRTGSIVSARSDDLTPRPPLHCKWRGGGVPGAGGEAGGELDGRGTRYLLAKCAAHRNAERLRARAVALAYEVDQAVGSLALARRRSVLPSPRLALRAAYLIELGHIEIFQGVFQEVRDHHAALHFLLSGPWPPYSFVTPPVQLAADLFRTLATALSEDPAAAVIGYEEAQR